MSIFVTLMIAGLVGLVLMAIPGLFRHGHGGAAPHGVGHIGHSGGHGSVHAGIHAGHGAAHLPGHSADTGPTTGLAGTTGLPENGSGGPDTDLFRFLPSPRLVFSLMTLFGAIGYALMESSHLTPGLAALIAITPVLLIERFAVTPLWNAMFRFQGTPSASLEALLLDEATAVTPFHNGRGIVSVVREGRRVQLRAELAEAQKTMPVRVGDTLLVEEVDAPNERVTVSLR